MCTYMHVVCMLCACTTLSMQETKYVEPFAYDIPDPAPAHGCTCDCNLEAQLYVGMATRQQHWQLPACLNLTDVQLYPSTPRSLLSSEFHESVTADQQANLSQGVT